MNIELIREELEFCSMLGYTYQLFVGREYIKASILKNKEMIEQYPLMRNDSLYIYYEDHILDKIKNYIKEDAIHNRK